MGSLNIESKIETTGEFLETEAGKAERAKNLYLAAELYRKAMDAYNADGLTENAQRCRNILNYLDD